jgi:hypothetical protein
MITAQEKEILRVFDLIGKQETDGLKRLFPSIDIVSKEKIVRFRREPPIFKQAQEIIELAMDITTYLTHVFR